MEKIGNFVTITYAKMIRFGGVKNADTPCRATQ